MSLLNSNGSRDPEQRRKRKALLRYFSGAVPDDTEECLAVEQLPIEFQVTAKLDALDRSGPTTPALTPDLDIPNLETVRVQATKLSDFAQGERGSRQSFHDAAAISPPNGVRLLWSIIAQYQYQYHSVPGCIFISPDLADSIYEDIDELYEGRFGTRIPFPNERGLRVWISVLIDNTLEKTQMRCRG